MTRLKNKQTMEQLDVYELHSEIFNTWKKSEVKAKGFIIFLLLNIKIKQCVMSFDF